MKKTRSLGPRSEGDAGGRVWHLRTVALGGEGSWDVTPDLEESPLGGGMHASWWENLGNWSFESKYTRRLETLILRS